jgi:hypothetical protein
MILYFPVEKGLRIINRHRIFHTLRELYHQRVKFISGMLYIIPGSAWCVDARALVKDKSGIIKSSRAISRIRILEKHLLLSSGMLLPPHISYTTVHSMNRQMALQWVHH